MNASMQWNDLNKGGYPNLVKRALPCVIYVLTLLMQQTVAAQTVQSWQEAKQTHVVTQTMWWSCGAAAVSTLLQLYFDIAASEATVITEAVRYIDNRSTSANGLSLYALQQALSANGVASKAYRLSPEQLLHYFARGGLPVIVHLTQPKAHFVVAVGIVADAYALADPSFGERLVKLDVLHTDMGFSGYVLVPIPEPNSHIVVKANQTAALLRFQQQFYHLQSLGGALHR